MVSPSFVSIYIRVLKYGSRRWPVNDIPRFLFGSISQVLKVGTLVACCSIEIISVIRSMVLSNVKPSGKGIYALVESF